jgi:hypothetical protein
MDIGELISKFIAKDSQSNIQSSSIMTDTDQAKTSVPTGRPST